jgi:hypothetical protein
VKRILAIFVLGLIPAFGQTADSGYGPAAALAFDRKYRGDCYDPAHLHCYPQAQGVPFADCVNIIRMTAALWTPRQLCEDFARRMQGVAGSDRKKGIIVVLKTERCATKAARACTITTAVLEKRSTPLVGQFLIYGVQLKPRDGDDPPGTLRIETGADAWKNDAAGEYGFRQGPGATLVFLDPADGTKVATTNAAAVDFLEGDFTKNGGRTPQFERLLRETLRKIGTSDQGG